MSKEDCTRGHIKILEDITVQTSSSRNSNSSQQSFHSPKPVPNHDKENVPDTNDYTIVDYENNSRRCWNSYFSDEEPVFSDSEEEREYTKRVLDSQNITYYSSNGQGQKNSVEIQCDLTPCDQEILQFAVECAKFNDDEVPDKFKELIQLCKHFSCKYQHNNAIPAIEKNTYLVDTGKSLSVTKISAEFMPSKQGSESDFETEHVEKRNTVNVCGDTENLAIRKSFKIKSKVSRDGQVGIRRSTRIHKLDNNKNATVTEKAERTDLKKEWRDIKNNNINLNKGRKRNRQTVEHIMRDFLYRSKKRKKEECDSNVNGTHIKIRLPRNIVRPLARNWMKPHKNTVNYHYLNYSEPTFSLLRGPKIRILYSPTHWLQSITRTNTRRYKK